MSKISNVQYELNILKHLLESKSPELLTKLSPDHFGNKDLGKLFQLVKGFYIDNGSFLGWDAIKSELSVRVKDSSTLAFVTGLVDDIRGRDISGLSEAQLVDELKKQLQFRMALDGVSSIVDSVDKKDADAVVGAMRDLYEKMFSEANDGSFLTADMVEMTGREAKFSYSHTGIPGIDKFGGLIESGLFMILGGSGRGKTHMATQWALYNHENYEGSTVVASWEQGVMELKSRLLANIAEVDLGKITLGTCTPDEKLRLRKAEVKHLCGNNEEALDLCLAMRDIDDKTFWDTLWSRVSPQKNRFFLFDAGWNYDELFINMELLVQTRNVKFFVIDYPTIISPGKMEAGMQPWQYALNQIGKLKNFCRRHNVRIVFPAQYGEKEDHIKMMSNSINFTDMTIALTEEEGDKEIGSEGALTVKFKKYRNFVSPDFKPPREFKVLKDLCHAKFLPLDF